MHVSSCQLGSNAIPQRGEANSLTSDSHGNAQGAPMSGIPSYGGRAPDGTVASGPKWGIDQVPTPRQLVEKLDEYVVGQSDAKKILAVGCFHHYQRVLHDLERQMKDDESMAKSADSFPQASTNHGEQRSLPAISEEILSSHSEETARYLRLSLLARTDPAAAAAIERDLHAKSNTRSQQIKCSDSLSKEESSASEIEEHNEVEIEKSNILILGPTGCGKTLLAKTLARLVNVPFAMADATTLTQAGYVGEDVESILYKLYQSAGYDVAAAQQVIQSCHDIWQNQIGNPFQILS